MKRGAPATYSVGMKRLVLASLALAALARADSSLPLLKPRPDGARVDPAVERFQIPLGGAPVRGPATARVTIVEYADFQCPFCGRVEAVLDGLRAQWPADVRIVWKNWPLPFHPNARPAARLAMAAHEKGRFWELHDLLLKQQASLDGEGVARLGALVGVTAPPADGRVDALIDSDLKETERFGVTGTPTFFINGRRLVGAQPLDTFKKMVEEELAAADGLLRSGVAPGRVYETLTAHGKSKADPPAPAAPAATVESDTKVYDVRPGAAPGRGPADAKVVIVEWSDFQCPFCARAEEALRRIEARFPREVRVVYKHQPLPFHPNARLAAEAAVEAQAQGRFWEFHDELFRHQGELWRNALESYAAQIGLDGARFSAALDDHRHADRVDAEMREGAAFGAAGTPTFFINGRKLVGAQPFESFEARILKELAR
jgi:protein-disulfide isomerase